MHDQTRQSQQPDANMKIETDNIHQEDEGAEEEVIDISALRQVNLVTPRSADYLGFISLLSVWPRSPLVFAARPLAEP
jgi:hypothetical protein